jgi:hypothetical protein
MGTSYLTRHQHVTPTSSSPSPRLRMSIDVQTGKKGLLQIGLFLPLHYPRLQIPVSELRTKSERKIFAATPQLLFEPFQLNYAVTVSCGER